MIRNAKTPSTSRKILTNPNYKKSLKKYSDDIPKSNTNWKYIGETPFGFGCISSNNISDNNNSKIKNNNSKKFVPSIIPKVPTSSPR